MLVGREPERARIGALIEAAHASRSGALVIRGEPGIGKTALLDDAREQSVGMHVLYARGIESESELPFAGVHQLLRPALHLVDVLPAPQALALKGALGLAEQRGDDRFLISAACLTLLSELSEERPVLCLVDDVHWLDTPSADALVFVARRLGAEGIAMLFTARESEARHFEARELPGIELGELDSASAVSLLGSQVPGPFDEGVCDRLVEHARGNALTLVELPAALSAAQLAGSEPLPETLPLPRGVEQLFLSQVRRLPEPTQRLLLLLAAEDSGTLGPVLQAGAALGIADHALDAAEDARLVSVSGQTVAFRHPLVRSCVYQSASLHERRAAHLALAEALSGSLEADQQVWHRAAAALGPDESIASELERAAERARRRSGHASAATALARAVELSVDARARSRRLVAAASASWQAGRSERASALLAEASSLPPEASSHGEAEHLRGMIALWCGNLSEACDILVEGSARVTELDPGRTLAMLFDGAVAAGWAGDFRRMAEVGRRAAALHPTGTEELTYLANLLTCIGGLWEGTSVDDVPLIREVLARADDFDEPRWLLFASSAAVNTGADEREQALLQRATTLARESGAIDTLAQVLVVVALNGVFTGRTTVVAEAGEGLALAREARLPTATTLCLAVLAWFAALRGDGQACRTYADEVTSMSRTSGNAFARSITEWGVARLELGAGRTAEASTRLESLTHPQPGVIHPQVTLTSAHDLVEAYVRDGRHDEARRAFLVLERFARPGAPPWALALAAQCRALLSHDPVTVEADFTEALEWHGLTDRRFDRARTQLLFGEHLRRRRRRLEARDHLRAALGAFESLGAAPWAERARAELRASGETARKRDPSTIDELTPQELQIAHLVAEGLSNKDVAAQLFLSPRTIDYHLRNVFAKLGITSRTQLARLPLGESVTDSDVPVTA
jgi:DNA-binding CsgD family transcriptional regulator